jgi:trehalose 6-phosphate phosphatase
VAFDPLAPLRADPGAGAVLLDVDGTLAPIAPHPDRSAVPAATLATLARLADRCALVACVSGRAARDAARLVPVPGIVVAGNHGLELLEDGAARWADGVERWLPAVRAAADALGPVALAAGGWVEDKGATLTVHVREAPDPDRARALLEERGVPVIAAQGLAWRWGRMALEARPPVDVDKGTCVRDLVASRPAVACSLYAGDDLTDLDALRAVDIGIAVRSDETPAAVLDAATLVVEGPAALADLLAGLAVDSP